MAQSMLILRMAVLMLFLESTEAKMQIIAATADVEIGAPVLLLCKAGGEGQITWQKDEEELEEGVEKVDETSSKVAIKNAKLEDAGRYVCMCDFDNSPKDSVSYQIYVYEPVSFGSTAVYHEFLEGTDAVVPCKVTGKPEVEVQWTREDEFVKRDGKRISVLSDNSLQIKDIKRANSGSYVCEGSIKGRKIAKKLNITVSVNVPPTVKIHEAVKSVMAGPGAVSLLCLVDGHPKPDITWTTPPSSDSSRYQYNSDRSELKLSSSVEKSDHGQYVCTAKNKIGENSATIMLDVSAPPEAFLSQEEAEVQPGQSISVACNVSGQPTPSLLWVSNAGHPLSSSEGRVRVEHGSLLVVEQVAPSDGGVYCCMALSTLGNATRDFSLQTHPGPSSRVSAFPGPTSVVFSLGGPQVDGGSPITHYILQWRGSAQDPWSEATIEARDHLAITSLKPYTSYSVRLAPKNRLGQASFSTQNTIRTQGIREPDCPELSASKARVDGNSFSVPFQQLDDGGSPITHYILRYRPVKEGEEWMEKKLSSDSRALELQDLQYNTDYHLELLAVNPNGSSTPAKLEFSTLQPPPVAKVTKMGKGGVVGIVMFIFLVLLLAVDATCCYTNRCGLLMFLAVRFFGQKLTNLKTLEEGDNITNGKMSPNGDPTTNA